MKKETIVKRMLSWDKNWKESGNGSKESLVFLASLFIGPNIKRLSKVLGYPRRLCSVVSRNLRKSQVWKGCKIYGDYSGECGSTALACDMAVASGWIKRTFKKVQPRQQRRERRM